MENSRFLVRSRTCSSGATPPHRTLFRQVQVHALPQHPYCRNALRLHRKKAEGCTGKIYILLDEIQEVERWQIAINSLRVDFACDIYLTGSNSKLLSGELATYLSGRYIQIQVFPPFHWPKQKQQCIENGTYTSDG